MTPLGSVLKFWPEKVHKVLYISLPKAKPDIQLLSGVLLQWLGTFNIHTLTVSSPGKVVVAVDNALLEGVRCHYGTIVGSFNSAKDTNKKKNYVWILITENVNAIGSGQRRTTDQIKLI